MEKNFLKCLILGVMVLVFWLCSFIVGSIVNDRSKLSNEAKEGIAMSWGGEQTFVGPIICVPEVEDGSVTMVPYTCINVLPERFEIDADVQSEVLHRGMFDAPVFRSNIKGKGVFSLAGLKEGGELPPLKKGRYDWSRAQVIVCVESKIGLEDGIKVKLGDKELILKHQFNNYGNKDIVNAFADVDCGYKGLERVCQFVDLSSLVDMDEFPFEVNVVLKGSSSLDFVPIGQTSTITMRGNSADPSFNGVLLPSSREVSKDGFTATWKVSSLNCSGIEQFSYLKKDTTVFSTVGTTLMMVGGQYTKIDRALKYAFLVLLLSLSAVFIAEMCVKRMVGLMNYFLIGCALLLFYLMLLSFAEWVGFTISYIISAVLILGMITFYLKAIVKDKMIALATCSFMALVDVFIFILLSIESMSLLVGTIGLFVVLGVAMFFSLRLVNE